MSELKPISPQEAVEWYLEKRMGDVADATLQAHEYRLSHFVRWCQTVAGIDNMNNLSTRDFYKFQVWRREDGECNKVTLHTQLSTLKVFIEFVESIEGVEKDYSEYIDPPTMSNKEDVRDVYVDKETADKILEHYRNLKYAERDHIIIELLWHTGMRSGALRSIDLKHVDTDESVIELEHNPEEGTPLKNTEEGMRYVAIKPEIMSAIEDYIAHNRYDKVDEYGRKPLITTLMGRPAMGTIRTSVYKATKPCVYSSECPHGREISECEANESIHAASKCPSTKSPHTLRKGAITWARRNDIPLEAVSERMDVSAEVLKKYFDKRSLKEQMNNRRGYFGNI